MSDDFLDLIDCRYTVLTSMVDLIEHWSDNDVVERQMADLIRQYQQWTKWIDQAVDKAKRDESMV